MRNTHPRLRLIFYINLLLILALVGYKIYLNFFEQDYTAVHARQVERIEARLDGKDSYRFAVVGNIKNSVGIFERQILPMLNDSGVDFVVSAGNAVSSGGEDKYRALYRTLSRLNMPYLLTFGENENSRLGGFRFYDHFGPYLFSFTAGGSRFIFLDSTGKTNYQWQLRWLDDLLNAPEETEEDQHRFVFSEKPLKPVPSEKLLGFDTRYLFPESQYLYPEPPRSTLVSIIENAKVDAVFSASLPQQYVQRENGTDFVVTGGGGGFVPTSEHGFYHYTEVSVSTDGVSVKPIRLDIGQHPFWRTLESLWFFIHSLFYVGYLNFILVICVLGLLGIWLYSAIFVDRDYYPNFDVDPTPFENKPIRVSMLTNNYLPFIGGVPLSIDRLRRGLKALGNSVQIVSPSYSNQPKAEEDVVRVPSILPLGKHREFKLANIFLPGTLKKVRAFKPDLIHAHHPFWLGGLGPMIARALNIPLIYTYHTRLEHYAHYVPLPGPLFRNLVSHALVRRFANRCDGVIVPTESAEEYLRMIGVKQPVFVQPTGIDYQSFRDVSEEQVSELRTKLEIEPDEKILISISRLSAEKNIGFMIDALGDLSSRQKIPFRCLILGDGNQRKSLQKQIDEKGMRDRIILVGSVPPDQMATYCRLGDLFVFASRSETQGMVILEAMAGGMPVVAVRSSGIDDIVEDGVNGFKTPLNGTQWRKRVETLLTDNELHQSFSANALNTAENHSTEEFSRSVVRIYATVLAEKTR